MIRLPGFLADPVRTERCYAFTGVALFDGTEAPVLPEATVVVRAGRIEAIGRQGDGVPDDATVIDGSGCTLMPGLVEAHSHITMIEYLDRFPHPVHGAEPLYEAVRGYFLADNLQRAMRMGVTTIRDVGAYGDVLLEARQAMRYGAFGGPRILTCGRIVSATAPGGRFFPGMYREADGPDDMRRAVREQIRRGADFVKIMSTGARSVEMEDPHPSQVTMAEMEAFVDEAHRLGFRAAAHAEGLGGTEAAILAGCDTIEHGFYLNQRPDLLEHMAEHDQTLVPTLGFLHHVAESGEWTDLLETQGEYNVEQAHLTLEAALAAGVRIAMGADAGDGEKIHAEIGWMVHHGMSHRAALVAGTSAAAEALGIADEVGTVESGKLADLVLVDGDPLADPALLGDRSAIKLVLRNGAAAAGTLLERDL
ncbi:MAG: amidohydrolase family protein [Acidimicrobiia bacterium]|nr:amidohydrolase family protein [Acidimicrobiia bacterium]